MYGIIVVGHGAFAPGITTSVKMIAGELDHYIPLEFLEEEAIDALPLKLQAAIDDLLQETQGILIFTDLVGGTPFKAAYTIAHGRDDLAVICGTNLGMLVEANFMRLDEGSLQDLARSIVEKGKDQVIYMEKIDTSAGEEGLGGEGI
jgi:PTS system N-acetylgalactosamine-specific IIA component